jgi:kynurenine formamidase
MGSAYDWVGLPLHGLYLTHLDAPAHISWEGRLYNGQPAAAVVTDRGATLGGVDLVHGGIFTRGVLLDVAGARGLDWLEGEAAATAADLDAAEARAGVRVEPGDVMLVRTGYGARRLDPVARRAGGQPGLDAGCLPWIHERSPAVLGTDTGTDPSPPPGGAHGHGMVASPVHVGCIAAMGMWVIDGCELEALAKACIELGRWEFLLARARQARAMAPRSSGLVPNCAKWRWAMMAKIWPGVTSP